MYKILTIFLLGSFVLLQANCDNNAEKLKKVYSQIKSCKDNYIIWKDGTLMKYDDKRNENFEKRLKHADIEDMFADRYVKGKTGKPTINNDPGRYRNDLFFRKMYGNSAGAVRKNLRKINWFGKSVYVTRINGVDKKLQAVAKELARYPKLKKFLVPMAGTFNWRKISGTNRLSVHSFGAAIDINVKYSAYWKWNKGAYRYQNKIPMKIIEVFEKHGFIWGGKWYHYDTMHFEYRPELM